MLDITEVRIHMMRNPNSNLKGFADIIISGCFMVGNIAIIQGPEYTYTAMPYRILPDNTRKDTVRSLTEDCERQVEGMVLDAYEDKLNQERMEASAKTVVGFH
jgi:DNA-binding cell septation regulator SpoVG